jgi:hypothetical protein
VVLVGEQGDMKMGWVPPPLSLSEEEFNKRVQGGAKTLKEIDPEFYRWVQSQRSLYTWSCYIIIGIILVWIGATVWL